MDNRLYREVTSFGASYPSVTAASDSMIGRSSRSREVNELIRRLEDVRRQLRGVESRVPLTGFGATRESARNLLHYVALRQFDMGKVQEQLADLGLSSLGRAESHVLYNIDTVLAQLYAMNGRPVPSPASPPAINPDQGRSLIARNASHLFGRAPPGRYTRIMVTMPTEAAYEPRLVQELVESGMDCLRINCAHDTEEEWLHMIRNLRRAERKLGRRCRVLMDLGGPRLRTGGIEPGPAVTKVRPLRDPVGHIVGPARIRLVAQGKRSKLSAPVDAEFSVPVDWVRRRRLGEQLRFRDTRDADRVLRVESRATDELVATLGKTAYLTNGTRLAGRVLRGRPDVAEVSGVVPRPGRIRLFVGDRLRLTRDGGLGRSGSPVPRRGRPTASIGVTMPEALARVRPGDRVWFDGGRIGGVVHSRSREDVLVGIEHARPEGTWLRGDQGINLPDTNLLLPPLTAQDRHDLRFIVEHADLVGYSFVQSADDLELLRDELDRLRRRKMGVVLKVETRRAFEQLPAILLSALRSGPAAVMLARGDLAVEVGFERLAEVQEEILWLCEAAHLPSIWATQVLEGLAKERIPSRAEVTDAAMGERAECVMLNKGPYLIPAVRALDSIVRRMQAHQVKKSARLRHLSVAERFLATAPSP